MASNSEDQHFQRVLAKTAVVMGICGVAYLLLIAWCFFSVREGNLRLLQILAALILAASAFAAGNTYRLKDVRRRKAFQLRKILTSDQDGLRREWASLVPQETITFRMRLSFVGATIGLLAQIAIMFVFAGNEAVATGVVATFLVFVVTLFTFLGGTFSRPID
ncbi:MAG: hypothetical protein ACK5MT_17785 [Actinomycetales bacterium]